MTVIARGPHDHVYDSVVQAAIDNVWTGMHYNSWHDFQRTLAGTIAKAITPDDLFEVNVAAEDWARERVGRLITDITKDQQDAVKRIVARGIRFGWSDAQLADSLGKKVGLTGRFADAVQNYRQSLVDKGYPAGDANRMSKKYADQVRYSRALTIARTEVQTALVEGQRIIWKEAVENGDIPKGTKREWVLHPTEATCSVCKSMSGRRATITGSYANGRTMPAHPNCRCSERLVTSEGLVVKIDTAAIAKSLIQRRIEKARVRTPGGAKKYGQPIGSVIIPNVKPSIGFGAMPLAVGQTPLPPNTVRAFHYTSSENADSIRKNGMKIDSARGGTYDEPTAIWFSSKTSEWGDPGSLSGKVLIEVALPKDVAVLNGGLSQTFAIGTDVAPESILAIHEQWHNRYRFFMDNGMEDAVKAGKWDSLISQGSEYAKAIAFIKHGFVSKAGKGPNPKSTPKEIVGRHGHRSHGKSILWPALYEHLLAKGMTKQKAAMISNGMWRKKRGLPPKSVPGTKGKVGLSKDRVRTPAGARRYKQPIGSVIVRDVPHGPFVRGYANIPEIDATIEAFLEEPLGDWTTADTLYKDLTAWQAAGACQQITQQFVAFAKERGLKTYSVDTDLEELGYKTSGKPQGDVMDEDGNIVAGFYNEHTVSEIYLENRHFPVTVDWSAIQYGYIEFPKVLGGDEVVEKDRVRTPAGAQVAKVKRDGDGDGFINDGPRQTPAFVVPKWAKGKKPWYNPVIKRQETAHPRLGDLYWSSHPAPITTPIPASHKWSQTQYKRYAKEHGWKPKELEGWANDIIAKVNAVAEGSIINDGFSEFKNISERGHVVTVPAVQGGNQKSHECHWNAVKLWASDPERYKLIHGFAASDVGTKIVPGLRLKNSKDDALLDAVYESNGKGQAMTDWEGLFTKDNGRWGHHSWVYDTQTGKNVETTGNEYAYYFGYEMTNDEAVKFADEIGQPIPARVRKNDYEAQLREVVGVYWTDPIYEYVEASGKIIMRKYDIVKDRVRTPAGAKRYHLPIGAEIKRNYLPAVGFLASHLGKSSDGTPYDKIMVDPSRSKRTAAAYEALPVRDPSAFPSYKKFIGEIDEQYKLLTETLGVTVEVVDEDPYPSVVAMANDLRKNKRIKVLATRATGSHPFLSDAENDRFRAVHDAFGHAATGRGFDRNGEEAAFQAHGSMFSALARRALASETRGQNSVLIVKGHFPEQKVALLPEELSKSKHKNDTTRSMADDDNLFSIGGIHHTSCGRFPR